MSGPLAGLRVLELARILAGPWAGQILADLGADVIKVERKGAGDDTRGWGPPFIEAAAAAISALPISTPPIAASARLRSTSKARTGSASSASSAKRSDVLIENFKVGGLAKFGLDYTSLSKVNPRLVYCSVTGFGQDGPYASRAGYDLMAQGMGGIMDITGTPEGEPTRAGVPVADIFTGVYSVIGIFAGLAQRRKTGRGCLVDTALLDSQVGVLANQALNYLVSGERTETHRQRASQHRAVSGVSGRRRPRDHRGRQRRAIRQAVRRARRASARPTRPTSPMSIAWAVAPNWAIIAHFARRFPHDRSAGQARGGRRAVRPDQSSRSGFRRSAGHPARHADQPGEQSRQGRQDSRRAHTDHGRRQADGGQRPSPRLGEHTAEILREIGEG